MLTPHSLFRRFVITAVIAGAAGWMPTAMAQSSALAARAPMNVASSAACPGSAHVSDRWASMATFLERHGLAIQPHCAGTTNAGAVRVVVVDSLKASEVLRGPLADGEALETLNHEPGNNAMQALTGTEGVGPDVAPDVHFNRRWLASALVKHQLLTSAPLAISQHSAAPAGLQLAAR